MRTTTTLANDLALTLVQKAGEASFRIVEKSARSLHIKDDPEKARLMAAVTDRLWVLLPQKGSTIDILV